MRNMGFTHVVLCWGNDTAAFAIRTNDNRYAMELVQRAQLQAYLLIWHPYANSLPRRPDDMQVDSAGKILPTFDVFNTEWRNTQWKEYLQTIAKIYGNNPALAGYVFDDSFEIGGDGVVSYGKFEKAKFPHPLPRKQGDPYWNEWTSARSQWWNEWASDTVRFIREIDSDKTHVIYLEDIAAQVLSPTLKADAGVDFPKIARNFDAVGGYTFGQWDASPDSGARTATTTRDMLAKLRHALGPNQRIIYTFWSANDSKHEPGEAKYPTVSQLKLLCQTAIDCGICDLDMYGYRIGEGGVSLDKLDTQGPGRGPVYPLSGQIPQTFLWDRPHIQDELGAYLRELNEHEIH
jgi:hypothetical protein